MNPFEEERKKAFQAFEQDEAKGFALYLALAEKGDPESIAFVGYLYRWGKGTPVDLETAESFLLRGAKLGVVRAAEEIWDLLQARGDSKTVVEALEKCANDGNLWALYHAGREAFRMLEDPRGLRWLERAADLGHVDSLLELCWIHDPKNGYEIGGPNRHTEWLQKALPHMETAANDGDIGKIELLTEAWMDGQPITGGKVNYTRAKELAEAGTALGSDECRLILARLYQNGWGVARDLKMAESHFELVSKNHPIAVEFFKTHVGAKGFDYRKWLGEKAKAKGRVE